MISIRTCLVACLCLSAAEAWAADQPGSVAVPGEKAPVERLIAQLASPEYATREIATTELMVRDDLDDETLKAAFRTAASPEQVHRLTRISLHRFYRRMNPPRPAAIQPGQERQGGLGVAININGRANLVIRQHNDAPIASPAFLVTERLPGFPAYAYLRRGDLILAVGGQRFEDDSSFSKLIQVYRAGDVVNFQVVRDDRVMELSIPLDSIGRLEAVYPRETPKDEAWAMGRPDFQRHLELLKGTVNIASLELQSPTSPPPAQSASAAGKAGAAVH